ncbi:peptidylprolyl isomerase fpr4 [Pleurotus pulmonarius]|nr:peptidylprolyl isomerase fpr4 [Pleurotus pulmonarius]KAF4593512.1 peptidylprolyl isomerase fpr4 [Pleurotus pulmonarius]
MTLWVLTIPSNSVSDPTTFTAPMRLTNIALAVIVGKDRCTIEAHLNRDGEDPVVCHLGSLIPGKVEHCVVDLVFDVNREIVFLNKGASAICLTGYFLSGPEGPAKYEGPKLLSRSDSVDSVAALLLPPVARQSRSDSVDSLATALQPRLKNPATLGRRNSSLSSISTSFHPLEVTKGRKRKSDAASTAIVSNKGKGSSVTNKRKLDNGDSIAPAVVDPTVQVVDPTVQGPPAASNGGATASNELSSNGLVLRDTDLGNVDEVAVVKGADVEIFFVLSIGKVDFRWRLPPTTFKFTVGDPAVIKGLSIGILGMHPEGERHLTIPAHLAFGAQGLSGNTFLYGALGKGAIPPNSEINMKVKLASAYLPAEFD